MKTRLIRIGNSRGVRIPKPFLKESNLSNEVDLEVRPNQIVIRSAGKPRQGWEEAARKMARRGDDKLLDEYVPTEWDKTEWRWE